MSGFVRRQIIRGRQRFRNWQRNHPRLNWLLHAGGCLHWDRESVARGIAVGLFVGLTPTVGIQIVFMLIGCMLLRGYFPAAFAISWISNPFSMLPLYWLFNVIGEFIFGYLLKPDVFFSPLLGDAGREILFGLLGSLLIAIPAAVAGYSIALRVWSYLSRKLEHKRAARRSARARKNLNASSAVNGGA